MLKPEENELLTRVGAGTPMGQMLRRYWLPACLAEELPEPDGRPRRVRLLGERLVAFRDSTGQVGLLDENCPHRGASLYLGRNEECGIRCLYHGWKMNVAGTVLDMPTELPDGDFKRKVKAIAYPTHEQGDVIWAYLGPRDRQPPQTASRPTARRVRELRTTFEYSSLESVVAVDLLKGRRAPLQSRCAELVWPCCARSGGSLRWPR